MDWGYDESPWRALPTVLNKEELLDKAFVQVKAADRADDRTSFR